MLSDRLFGVSLLAASIVAVLCATSAPKRKFRFWPPPRGGSRQHISFGWLFRLFVYPLVVLTFIELEAVVGVRALVQYSVGALALIVGFGVAFLVTLQMGWRNAFGERRGLETTGWFSRSRNPVYVATWLGLVGWALVANSWWSLYFSRHGDMGVPLGVGTAARRAMVGATIWRRISHL